MPNSSGPNTRPTLYYITGPSGGGKSTLAGQSGFTDHFDRDHLVKQLAQNNSPQQAQRLADRAEIDFWDRHLEDKSSFSTERPLNYRSALDWIQEAKDAGFQADVAFIAAGDAETHVQRVHRRIAEGDHAVADAEIRSIHKRSMENLPLLLEAAASGSIDNVRVYDNRTSDAAPAVLIEAGKPTFLSEPAPAWLSQALERSPYAIPQLKIALERGLTLADLDPARELRGTALAKQLTPPTAFEYLEVAEMYGPTVIADDMDEARARLLRNTPPADVVREIAASHGYSSEIREYADTLVTAVETQLASELEGIADAQFNPTTERRGPLRFWQEETAAYTIKHAAGQLTAPDASAAAPRDLAAQRAVSRGTGDHAGHLIAHQFGGPEIPANLGLQNHIQNQGGGTYWQLENQWANSLREGVSIDVHVREMIRTGEDRAAYRNVEWTELHPDGTTVRDSLAFMNTTSLRSREATGEPVAHYDTPAQVIDLRGHIGGYTASVLSQLTDIDTADWQTHGGGAVETRVHTAQDTDGKFHFLLESYVPGAMHPEQWDATAHDTRQQALAAGEAEQRFLDEPEVEPMHHNSNREVPMPDFEKTPQSADSPVSYVTGKPVLDRIKNAPPSSEAHQAEAIANYHSEFPDERDDHETYIEDEEYVAQQRALANEPPTYNDWQEYKAGEHFLTEEEEDAARARFFRTGNESADIDNGDDGAHIDPEVAAEIEAAQQQLRKTQEQLAKQARETDQDTDQDREEEKGEPIAVRLTEEQAKLILSSEYPNDGRKQTTALANIYNGDEEINVFNESVQLDYSEDEQTFFAILEQGEKPALDAKLTQLQQEQEREKEAQQKAQDPRQRERTRERSRERD